MEVSFFELFQVDLRTPLDDLTGNPAKLVVRRGYQRDLARLQEADDPLPEPDGHGRVAQAGKARDCGGSVFGSLDGSLLDFQTGGAGAIDLGQHGTKRVLVGL